MSRIVTDSRNSSDESSFLRASLDAVPALVFIVDEDVRILDCNTAASRLLDINKDEALMHRAGDVLHCLHSTDHPDGCGRGQFCRNCVIRSAVNSAFLGQATVRKRARMDLLTDDGVNEINALVSVTRYVHEGRQLALLIIEDISRFEDFPEMLSICSKCKKVRQEDQKWADLEDFFKRQWDMDFSHGYCPQCAEAELSKIDSHSPRTGEF